MDNPAFESQTIPVAVRSRAWVCGRSVAGTVGPYLAGGMDVCVVSKDKDKRQDNQDKDVRIKYRMRTNKNPGSDKIFFVFSKTSRPALEPRKPPTQCVPRLLYGDEVPGNKVNRTPQSNAKVENECSCTSALSICFHGVDRDIVYLLQLGLQNIIFFVEFLTPKNWMQASEMKYLRKVIGKTRRDQIRNTTIRNQSKQESVEVLMEKRTLRWYAHAVRMDLERRPKLLLEARPEGGRGRPRLEWEEHVEGLARKRGRKLPEVKRLAQDRKEYRKWLLLKPDA